MKIAYKLIASLLVAGMACVFTPSSATAQDSISFGIGSYDILDDEGAVDLRLEYRADIPVLVHNLNPWAGIEVTSDGSAWAGGGLLYDIDLNDGWHVVPSFGVGLYGQGGSDKDLGHIIEFRSQIEGAYEFETGQRVGIAFGHLSNASLDDQNPGTEVLNLYYHLPY